MATERMPFRLTEKLADGAVRGKADHTSIKNNPENPAAELEQLIQSEFDADAIAKIEDELQDVLDRLAEKNSVRQYTQAHHLSFVQQFAILQSKIMGLVYFSGRRRRELEARVAQLETRPTLKYAGVWNVDTQANENEIYTDRGSAWYCRRSTRARPGSSNDFQLMVKRGADAKGAK